jgi:hypothetical protein
VLDAVLNVAHVELECGHTVVIMNNGPNEARLVRCGECEDANAPEAKV